MKFKSVLNTTLLIILSVCQTQAARLGEKASVLTIKEWVKGSAVDPTDGKNIYVVEFWATWCPPCMMSVPHLTELQRKFKDKGVVIIGITDEPADDIKPFVNTMGEKMDYLVACDDSRKSHEGYAQAYGQNGIPIAFIVGKDGKVNWMGHPMFGLDKAIEEMLAGTYDLQTAIKNDEPRAEIQDFEDLSAKADPKAKEAGKKLLDRAGNDIDALCKLGFSIVGNMANTNKNFDFANEVLDKAERIGGKDHRILGIRSISLFESGKKEEGMAMVKQALDLANAKVNEYKNFLAIMESRMPKQPVVQPETASTNTATAPAK